jgi:DNA-binding transcriptional LysR family regulator
MDLNRLRTFAAVARLGNLTRAAENLCLSQPAVSGHLKALEDELGLKLFARVPRGMELTHAGRTLLHEVEQTIASAQQIEARARSLRNGIVGEFRIGTIAEPSILRLGQTVCRLTSCYPDLRLRLLQGISGDIIDWVLEDSIDAGYVIGYPDDINIAAVEIASVTLQVVAPANWAERIKFLDWADVAALPWISTPPKCSFSRLAKRMFSRHGVKPRTVVEADQEHVLRDLVTSEAGLTLLREDVALEAEAAGDVVIWKPGVEISHLYFIFRHEKVTNALLQAILRIIKEIWEIGKV